MTDRVEVRLVEGEDRLRYERPLTRYAFTPSPRPDDDLEAARRRLSIGRWRVFVAFDGDEPRAAATGIEMTQNVRGRLLPMGGVAGVATHPAARRAGYARRVLTHLLADLRDRGQVVSALYPFRASFYERFGYVGLPPERRATIPPRDLLPLLRSGAPGEVTLRPYAEAAADVRAVTEAVQRYTHGMALRADPGLASARSVDDLWAAVATVDGEPAGYAAYRVDRYGGQLWISRFLYRDVAVRALLLGWLSRHTDQVDTLSIPLLHTDRPESWVTDATLRVEFPVSPVHNPAPMARILSVPGLAGIAAGPAEVTLRIDDPLIGGVYTLTGTAGTLSVADGGTPEATLTGHALAALVYGVLDPAELPFRGFGTPPPDTTARLRTLFPRDSPYLLESF